MRDLDLPHGRERDVVHDARDREYTQRGSETRTLSTVGAFGVVPARELRDHSGREADPRNGDLRHLREQRLIETVRLPGQRDTAVVLTDRGRDLKVPVLLIHGSADSDTPPEHSQRVLGALAGAKRLILVSGARHNESLRGAAWKEVERWIDQTVHQ